MYFIAGIRGDVVYTYTEMKNKLKFTGYLVVVAGIVLSMCSPLKAQDTLPKLKGTRSILNYSDRVFYIPSIMITVSVPIFQYVQDSLPGELVFGLDVFNSPDFL